MSLVTLETIKAAVPTLLPTIGTFLGRAVTVITSNPDIVNLIITNLFIACIVCAVTIVFTVLKNEKRLENGREEIQDLTAQLTMLRAL